MTSDVRGGGGSIPAVGLSYQEKVAIWFSVQILMETEASPPWGLSANTTFESLRCEAAQSVDDIIVETSNRGHLYIQAKRSLDLSPQQDSKLYGAIDQFVRQFLQGSSGGRQLDIATDRIMLITSSNSPNTILKDLASALDKLRDLYGNQSLNKKQKNALSVVSKHVNDSFRVSKGVSPSQEEIDKILSLIYVQKLDVEEDGDQEREAKKDLRVSVLSDPAQADQAWPCFFYFFADRTWKKTGADRHRLQLLLVEKGFKLKGSRSYREDIERLKRHSHDTSSSLSQLSCVQVGDSRIKIDRPCVTELRRLTEEGNLLVIGEPGAGKSGALYDLVKILKSEGRNLIFFAAERIKVGNFEDLQSCLRLQHDLRDVMKESRGDGPSFLVIDALDASRANPSARLLRDLMRWVHEEKLRWHVVASIRKFDLRYSEEFQVAFKGTPSTELIDQEFKNLRHLNIPCLNDAELHQVQPQNNELYHLFEIASEELRELLRVPFNLRIMAELLGSGLDQNELTPIKTQIELFEGWWRYWVRNDSLRDAREHALRLVCEGMVDNRALRLERQHIQGKVDSEIIDDLLSNQILSEWQPEPDRVEDHLLVFPHHVLFDYSVARLILRPPCTGVTTLLSSHPDLSLTIQPSLRMHFQWLWNRDEFHNKFWDSAFQLIMTESIPETGKLIAPTVASELTRMISDLEGLFKKLENSDSQIKIAAERVFVHLVNSIVALRLDSLTGDGAGPWCEALERVTRHPSKVMASLSRWLLTHICEHPEKFTHQQLLQAGEASRRLLEQAWADELRNSNAIRRSIESACRTFGSDPMASASLLRHILDSDQIEKHGFEEIPWLAREVKHIIPHDPTFVDDIYRATFLYKEISSEEIRTGGPIMSFIRTRRDDYRMAYYHLVDCYLDFLRKAPGEATRTLILVLDNYVRTRHSHQSSEWKEEEFDWDGSLARVCADLSFIWDAPGMKVYKQDEPLQMLKHFEDYVGSLEKEDVLQEITKVIASTNRMAILWRRLLHLGARSQILGKQIKQLVWALPILVGPDTTTAAGEFLKAFFPQLSVQEREAVERTILDIPKDKDAENLAHFERKRNRLLGCLDPSALVTHEALQLQDELIATDDLPENEPPMAVSSWRGEPFGEKEYLAELGVPVDEEPNKRIREIEEPVHQFGKNHLNSTPTHSEIEETLPSLKILRDALHRAESDGVHPCRHPPYLPTHFSG